MSKEKFNHNEYDLWVNAAKIAMKSLGDFLQENEKILKNDRVGIHAKEMIQLADDMLDDEFAPLHSIQTCEAYLQKLHRTLKARVKKLEQGQDPDETPARAVLRAIQAMLSKNANAPAFFERNLHQHNQETRSEKNQ